MHIFSLFVQQSFHCTNANFAYVDGDLSIFAICSCTQPNMQQVVEPTSPCFPLKHTTTKEREWRGDIQLSHFFYELYRY